MAAPAHAEKISFFFLYNDAFLSFPAEKATPNPQNNHRHYQLIQENYIEA